MYAAAAFTRRWYDDLPELYRTMDAAEPSGGGEPLLRFLDLLGEQADEVENLAEQIEAGDLTDPAAAPTIALPWLAQMVGVKLAASMSEADQRAAIAATSSGWRAGTRASVAAAAQMVLTGTKYVSVLPHGGSPSGDPWTIVIVVRADETPGDQAVIDAVIAAGAKPAGYLLEVVAYGPEWSEIDALGSTWVDIDAAGPTWASLDSTGA